MKAERYYAVYRGDGFVTVGKQREVAEELGVKPNTIHFWTTPTYRKRLKEGSKALLAIRLEDD